MPGPDDTNEGLRARLDDLFEALRTALPAVEQAGGDAMKLDAVLDLVRPALDDEVPRAESSAAATFSLAHLVSAIVDRAVPPPGAGSEIYQPVYDANNRLKAWLSLAPSGPEPMAAPPTAATPPDAGSSGTGPGEEFGEILQRLAQGISDEQVRKIRTAVRDTVAAVRRQGGGYVAADGGSDDLLDRLRDLVQDVVNVIKQLDDDKCPEPDFNNLKGLAAAQASKYEGSAKLRICFLKQALAVLEQNANDNGGSIMIPTSLIPPITNVIEAVLDDDNPAAPTFTIRQLDRMIGLKQDITPLLQQAVQNAGLQSTSQPFQAFLPPVARRPGS
jgi:hypothetical protein